MRKIILPVFFLFAACKQENKNEFTVSGKVANAGGKMIYLEETPLGTGQRIIVDSATIGNNGSYRLKVNRAEESLFQLHLKDDSNPIAFVINDASSVQINVDPNDRANYSIQGSGANKSVKDFLKTAGEKYMRLYKMGAARDSLRAGGANDSALLEIDDQGNKLWDEIRNDVRSFVEKSSSPIASILVLESYRQLYSSEEYLQQLNSIVKRFPSHKGLANVKDINDRQAELARKQATEPEGPQWVGKEAAELSLPDVNGKPVSLSSFRGKYVLVDFWASWCVPCRRENPAVVNAYNKFKDKNFTIVGVSLDKEKSDWLQAIKEDKLTWTHISDLKHWNSIAVSTYNISGIPFNVLVAPDGKIIAQGLRGEDLEAKLTEVLK